MRILGAPGSEQALRLDELGRANRGQSPAQAILGQPCDERPRMTVPEDGVEVSLRPAKRDVARHDLAEEPSDGIAPVPGSAGDFNWGGYAGTAFWVDPKEQLVAVFMVQSAGALRTYHRTLFRQLVYQAIID